LYWRWLKLLDLLGQGLQVFLHIVLEQAALLRRQGFAFGSELQPFEHGAFQRQLLQQGILGCCNRPIRREAKARSSGSLRVSMSGVSCNMTAMCGRAHSFGQLGAFRIDYLAMFLNDLITPCG
jgi:hypothetical protein